MHRRTPMALAVVLVAATLAGGGGCEKPLALTDTGTSPWQLTVSPKFALLRTTQTLDLTAVALTASGDTAAVTVTWSVTSGSMIDTSTNGGKHKGRYRAGTDTGKVKVVAMGHPGSQSDTAVVTVTPVPVMSVIVSPASATVLLGQTTQLSATTLDSAGDTLTGRTVTWGSNNTGVATVSATGLVTGKAAGTAIVTAASEGKANVATVTVTLVPVASVTVSPGTASIYVGGKVQLTATAKDSAGNTLTGRAVSWVSNATAVATVSTSGLVTGVTAGAATVTATSEGKTASAAIAVALVPVASVTVSPASASVQVGATTQLTATVRDSAGNTLTGRTISWSSSATGVATVSSTGLVTAVVAGSATITAASGGKSATSVITVTTTLPVTHAGWYASPGGTSSGSGSSSSPWDLQTALNGGNGKVQPGDTIWLRGGTYSGTFVSSLTGTATAPIVVRQYPGERATIDGGTTSTDALAVDGQWAIYWGFEIMMSGTQRFGPAGFGTPLRGDGVYVRNASNVKLINLIVHDVGHGTFTENAAHNIEIYGWIIYNGGNEDASRSDGHGIYIKNDGIGWKVARDNVIFNQFGFGIHGYAESGTLLKNIVLDGNVVFDNGTVSDFTDNANLQLGGTVIADNDSVTNNMLYFASSRPGDWNARIGYNSVVNGTALFRSNYITGGTEPLDVGYWSNLTVQANTVTGPALVVVQHDGGSGSTEHWAGNMHYRDPTARAWQLGGTTYAFSGWESAVGAADQASGTLPSAPQVFVRPNRYEPGRATIVIYNWPLQSSVPVDVSGVVAVGSHYEVRNVQDIFGTPIVSGTYGGGTINVPMNGVTPPQPIGGAFQAPIKTGPNFDVFVVTTVP